MNLLRSGAEIIATFEAGEGVTADLLRRLVTRAETEHSHCSTLVIMCEPSYFHHFSGLFLAEKFTPTGYVTQEVVRMRLTRTMRPQRTIENAGLAVDAPKLSPQGYEQQAIAACLERFKN
jgi:hypothetical protein